MQDFYREFSDTMGLYLQALSPLGLSCTKGGLRLILPEEGGAGPFVHPLIGRSFQKGRQLFISPSELFYRQAIPRIIEDGTDLLPLEDVKDDLSYAYMRLYMQCRRFPGGELLSEEGMNALWLCMGTVERRIDLRVRRYRLKAAAEAVLALEQGGSPLKKRERYRNTGLAAEAMAKLLLAGQRILKEI